MIRARWTLALLVPAALTLAAFDDPPAKPATTPQEVPPAKPKADDDEDVIPEKDKDLVQGDRFGQLVRQYTDRLDAQYGKGFFTYFFDDGVMPRPYLVAAQTKSNADPKILEEEYAEILGYLYKEFYRQYGSLTNPPMPEVTEPVPVLIFGSRDDYKKVREAKPELDLANEEFIGGYYIPSEGVLIQWRQDDLWHVIFHEGTHQLVDFATGRRQFLPSPWLSEGIADYMGGHTTTKRYDKESEKFVRDFELGQFIADRFQLAQNAILAGSAMTVKELVAMDFIAFKQAQDNQEDDKPNFARNREITGLVYAQGWALVKFLNETNEGAYKPLFNQFLAEELKGNGNVKSFAKIFALESDADWDDLDEAYRDYVTGPLRQQRLAKAKGKSGAK